MSEKEKTQTVIGADITHGAVIDIGGSAMGAAILTRLRDALYDTSEGSPIVLPDELLYDDKGLAIWAEIIFTPENYQATDEMKLFEANSPEIAKHIPEESVMVDLGAGDLRKVGILLAELEQRESKTTYLALDISQASLSFNLETLSTKHSRVLTAGLWGDFSAGYAFVAALPPSTPRVLLSLGSVLFNDEFQTALTSLQKWASLLQQSDIILAGMDGHTLADHRDKIWAAYHAHEDLFARFWANGFEHANRLLGGDILKPDDWDTCAELDEEQCRHRFFFRARRDIDIGEGRMLHSGCEMDWFDAHKNGVERVRQLCGLANLEVLKVWKAPGSEMYQYLLRKKGRAGSPADSAISDMQ
ncbi:hypothetical protein BN1723_001868 [Verticillium longisporum]|uniref:Histidine-specific methyltransferase SAM-dependent domain-containing protein n=1 Tax=Verticillium longisporum TaxID=100787 RepID=A0A0G4L455_VERLO|nr:N-methyltransferase imqF like protein [Verticillium longisporum]CRK12619.1 hypothetical protein BN1723_001868 [Verticillium longisporum]CRK16758.1 hypothetical protein BN1708_011811 [Verticillium longisporum]